MHIIPHPCNNHTLISTITQCDILNCRQLACIISYILVITTSSLAPLLNSPLAPSNTTPLIMHSLVRSASISRLEAFPCMPASNFCIVDHIF
eukprot:c14986_g1_i1 orf=787-1062(+)